MRILVRPQRKPKDYYIPRWVPYLGDEVEFAGDCATGMEFPQGVVHRRGYQCHGNRGLVVGWIGNQLVVRTGESAFGSFYADGTRAGWPSTSPPGHAYGDSWAPVTEFYLIKHGSNVDPPHVPPPGPYGSGLDIEDILQMWAKEKGLGPVPPFNVEDFIRSNEFINEPTKVEWTEFQKQSAAEDRRQLRALVRVWGPNWRDLVKTRREE